MTRGRYWWMLAQALGLAAWITCTDAAYASDPQPTPSAPVAKPAPAAPATPIAPAPPAHSPTAVAQEGSHPTPASPPHPKDTPHDADHHDQAKEGAHREHQERREQAAIAQQSAYTPPESDYQTPATVEPSDGSASSSGSVPAVKRHYTMDDLVNGPDDSGYGPNHHSMNELP